MMEGYFVRSLGMHRVYNSAFMNMLRDEKNQEYRQVIKNTIEFDLEILKRYVNFMNNPDERTAVDQFGKGDKYFGISTLMATMPGLPMFGHGQIEGFTEKYGMEYRRAYWEETPDAELVERHEREIFPLLRRRHLFADAHNFRLYDFYTPEGFVNEDVYAYSNRAGDQRALVVFHNRYGNTAGWIRLSAAYPIKTGNGDGRSLVQNTLGQGLDLSGELGYYTIFREHISGLEYIRLNRDLHHHGLYVELAAYKYQVFLNFRQVFDDESAQYARLAASLGGRGVPSMDIALKEMHLAPVLAPFRELVNPGMLNWLIANRWHSADFQDADFDRGDFIKAIAEFEDKSANLLEAINLEIDGTGDPETIAAEMASDLRVILALPVLKEIFPEFESSEYMPAIAFLNMGLTDDADDELADTAVWATLIAWSIVRRLGKALSEVDFAEQSRTWIDEWLFGKIIGETLEGMGVSAEFTRQQVALVRLFTTVPGLYIPETADDESMAAAVLRTWLADPDVRAYLYIHSYNDIDWFNKERFESLCWWAFVMSAVRAHKALSGSDPQDAMVCDTLLACYNVAETLLNAADESGYRVDKLLENIQD
jgi:hypothetical protein